VIQRRTSIVSFYRGVAVASAAALAQTGLGPAPPFTIPSSAATFPCNIW
jgi:hypothetical protein